MESHWKHFAVFLLGFLLILSSIGVGLGAVKFEFVLIGTPEEPSEQHPPLMLYEDLPPDEQRIVRDTIAGDRYVSATEEPIPGPGTVQLGGEMLLYYQDEYYLFARQPFYVTTSPAGLGGIALALGGLLLMGEAIRRNHFPNYRPLASLR